MKVMLSRSYLPFLCCQVTNFENRLLGVQWSCYVFVGSLDYFDPFSSAQLLVACAPHAHCSPSHLFKHFLPTNMQWPEAADQAPWRLGGLRPPTVHYLGGTHDVLHG